MPACKNNLSLGVSWDRLLASGLVGYWAAFQPKLSWNLHVFSAESHPGPMGESQVPALEMGGPEEISARTALGRSATQG